MITRSISFCEHPLPFNNDIANTLLMESQLGDILQSFYTKAFRRLEIDWDTNHPVTERMATKSGFDSLPKLGIAIDTSLASWEAYMETLTDQPTYESIISNNNTQDTFTKAHALFYLIETLPTRHAVLVISYSDTKVKFVELSNPCANLFEELQKPDSDAELKAWFDRVMTSHKLINGIAEIERNLEMVEQGRMQELKRLKASHVSLM